jgi:hypothetical protein
MSALVQDSLDLEKQLISSPPQEQAHPRAEAVVQAAPALASPATGYSGIADHSTPAHALLEHTTSILFPVLFVPNVYFSFDRLYQLELLWLAALAIPLALVLGDFVGGLVHWAADTYCRYLLRGRYSSDRCDTDKTVSGTPPFSPRDLHSHVREYCGKRVHFGRSRPLAVPISALGNKARPARLCDLVHKFNDRCNSRD